MKVLRFPEEDISWLDCYTNLPIINDYHDINVNARSITQKPQIEMGICGLACFFLKRKKTLQTLLALKITFFILLSQLPALLSRDTISSLPLVHSHLLIVLFSFPETSSDFLPVLFPSPSVPLCSQMSLLSLFTLSNQFSFVKGLIFSIWLTLGKKFPLQERIRILSWRILCIWFLVYNCVRQRNQ